MIMLTRSIRTEKYGTKLAMGGTQKHILCACSDFYDFWKKIGAEDEQEMENQ